MIRLPNESGECRFSNGASLAKIHHLTAIQCFVKDNEIQQFGAPGKILQNLDTNRKIKNQ